MITHPLIKTLDIQSQNRMKSSIEKIIANKEFNLLVQKDIKTEVTFGIYTKSNVQIGRIDLLAIDTDEVSIIDYKSDISPPSEDKVIPENYSQQLLTYKEMAREIYPGRLIRTMILWLQNGTLQTINNENRY